MKRSLNSPSIFLDMIPTLLASADTSSIESRGSGGNEHVG